MQSHNTLLMSLRVSVWCLLSCGVRAVYRLPLKSATRSSFLSDGPKIAYIYILVLYKIIHAVLEAFKLNLLPTISLGTYATTSALSGTQRLR